MSTSERIYTGVWTNHNYNGAEATTLTLTTTNSSYLVAFLALFVGLVAGHFWALLCYAVFQMRSTVIARTGMHHQQQVILRNYHAPGSAAWQLLKGMDFWRRQKGFRSTFLAVPVVILAATNLVLFGAAGIFSSRVTNKDSEVLLKGDVCGFWNNPATSDVNAETSTIEARTAYFANLIEDFATASTMASTCSEGSSITSNCVSYAPENIRWDTITNGSCPFDSKICRGNHVVKFDSGLLDSTKFLGMNAPRNDRILFRRVIECSPLVQEGYMSDWHSMGGAMLNTPGQAEGNMIPTQEGEGYLEFFYGPNHYIGLNSTFMHSNASPSYNLWGGEVFTLQSYNSLLGFPEASYFTPIPELNRTDADINLLFLGRGNTMRYTAPVDDPWFEAKEPNDHVVQAEFGRLQNVTDYHAEWPISVVGCTSQYQWCDPATGDAKNPACTELTGIDAVFAQAKGLYNNPKQKMTLKRMSQVIGSIGDITRLVSGLTGSVLQVNRYGNHELGPLPSDQWIRELSHMFGTLMTVMQVRNYRYTGGYTTGLKIQPAITPPLDNETWMCESQMVRRSDYQSFSVLGLAIIIGVGGAIVLLNLTLDSIVGWYQKKYHKREHATMEWELLETEKLQRLAYQIHGVDMLDTSCTVAPLLGKVHSQTVTVVGESDGKDEVDKGTPESPQVMQREFAGSETSQARASEA